MEMSDLERKKPGLLGYKQECQLDSTSYSKLTTPLNNKEGVQPMQEDFAHQPP